MQMLVSRHRETANMAQWGRRQTGAGDLKTHGAVLETFYKSEITSK